MTTFNGIPQIDGKNVWSVIHDGDAILSGNLGSDYVFAAFRVNHSTNPLTASQLAEWGTTGAATLSLADSDTVFYKSDSNSGTVYLDLYDYAEDGCVISVNFTIVDIPLGDSVRFGAGASSDFAVFEGVEHPTSPFFNGEAGSYSLVFTLDSDHRYLKWQFDSGDRLKFNNFIVRASAL